MNSSIKSVLEKIFCLHLFRIYDFKFEKALKKNNKRIFAINIKTINFFFVFSFIEQTIIYNGKTKSLLESMKF